MHHHTIALQLIKMVIEALYACYTLMLNVRQLLTEAVVEFICY